MKEHWYQRQKSLPVTQKPLYLFYMRKQRPENVFLSLIVNYRKIVQKNKLCHPKQQ